MMKKSFIALMLLPLAGLFTSCHDDENDLPEVDFEVAISGGVQNPDDNKIYVEQGTPLVIESITPVSRNGKKTTLGLTTYYLNGIPQMQTVTAPFGAEFDTSVLEPGEYAFQIKTSVYQIDKSAAFALLSYDLVVEAPESGDDSETTPGRSIVHPDDQQIAEQ
ncbi:MAG: hypothetical protein NC301_06155 [Bacteroides sp.]|nr:hypothetical protein [Bacteroides sp.]MCM1380108.1 hypothetical protein [Bacteroides sp.]MCM1445659.1 hypothetical protein [Prevotella sp.]